MTKLIKRIYTSLILVSILYVSVQNLPLLIMILILVNFLVVNELNFIFKKIFKKNHLLNFLFLTFGIIYINYFCLLIATNFIVNEDLFKFSLIFLILICATSDVGGYIFGNIIGGKKLTKISPNKTYSGLIGSFILSLIFGYLYFIVFEAKLAFKINPIIFILIVSLISQIGDLIISFLKRKANIKDTGSILPGHGGILDRIDGIIFALPIGVIFGL